jgi:NitT/TauT family transport system substrate-binding protein
MQITQSRRRFLASASMVGAAGLVGGPRSLHAEPPPETPIVRFEKTTGGICVAPMYVVGELLHAEGFAELHYVPVQPADLTKATARGEADFSLTYVTTFVASIDTGNPITLLAGVHSGCFELFVNDWIHGVRDLKGKRVGVPSVGSPPYRFLSVIASQVGLDPGADINWVKSASVKPMELFAEGKIDAFLGFPPEPQELRARKVGRVIVNSASDKPWSQYFCCMLAASTDFAQKYPVATKRVLRAVFKAADLCMTEPERVAHQMVDGGFTPRYDYALQTLKEVPYSVRRDYDAEDTVRFYALRMQEAGLIKSNPQKIIADGTDWRFLDELKRELKT